MQLFTLIPEDSRFNVRATAAGVLAWFGHSPTLAIRRFSGSLELDRDDLSNSRLTIVADARSLEVIDDVKKQDRQDILQRTEREVLQTAQYPEARYETTEIRGIAEAQNRYTLSLAGLLLLHGVEKRVLINAIVRTRDDQMRIAGEFTLRQTDFGIERITWSVPIGDVLTVKDEVVITFDLAGELRDA